LMKDACVGVMFSAFFCLAIALSSLKLFVLLSSLFSEAFETSSSLVGS
jgi:hypothetical protein